MTLILENVDSKLLQVIESLKGLRSDFERVRSVTKQTKKPRDSCGI